jgi:hypothetical protein
MVDRMHRELEGLRAADLTDNDAVGPYREYEL